MRVLVTGHGHSRKASRFEHQIHTLSSTSQKVQEHGRNFKDHFTFLVFGLHSSMGLVPVRHLDWCAQQDANEEKVTPMPRHQKSRFQ